MYTCLSGLWDVLINHVIEMKYISSSKKVSEYESTVLEECRQKICHKIGCFYRGIEELKPTHLKVFCEVLSCSDKDLYQAAIEATKCVDKCNLCIGCTECAKKFYNMILSEKEQERALPNELIDYFGSKSQFYYYLSAYSSVKEYRKIENTLICLKGFSSTTPSIYSASFEDTCTGGGIYLNVGGYGVVIDPGIGFVDSMHKQGIFIEDINAVIVTHNHLDHNADVSTLSALSHDINSYYGRQVSFFEKFFQDTTHRKHSIEWILDKGTKDSIGSIIENDKKNENCKELVACGEWNKLSERISMLAIKTQHMRKGVSYGIKFKILMDNNEIQIGYTSDTKFFEELAEFFIDTNILIFNISDIYEKDVRGTKSKSAHLGYDGSVKLLTRNSQYPQLAIASEFCCSNGDYRMRVTKRIAEQVGRRNNVSVIPGEVGLKIDLTSGKICCSRCKRAASVSDVSIVAPEKEFGVIQYVCNKCQYTIKKG